MCSKIIEEDSKYYVYNAIEYCPDCGKPFLYVGDVPEGGFKDGFAPYCQCKIAPALKHKTPDIDGGWQACPICGGTGTDYSGLAYNTSNICTVCNGKKIISKLTGKPPSD